MSWFWRIFFPAFGLLFVGAGLLVGIGGTRMAQAAAARAEGLSPSSAVAIEDRAAGAEILVEGVLSPRNPARFRDFVAYVREEYRGEDDEGRDRWEVDERLTPALLIEAGGLVQVGNDDYILERAHAYWREEGMLRYRGGEGTKRYAGLLAGGQVMAIGRLEHGAEGNQLRAERIFAGTRAEYIAGLKRDAAWLPWLGVVFGLAGAAIMAVGVFVARR